MLDRKAAVAWLLGALVLLGAWRASHSVGMFGFWDGFTTDLERAYTRLWIVVRIPTILLALDFIALGCVAPRAKVEVWFWISVVVLVLSVAGLWITCEDLASHLDDGSGG